MSVDDVRRDLEQLAKREDVRSADRARIKTFVRKLKKGQGLDYQERHDLWAYYSRYHVPFPSDH